MASSSTAAAFVDRILPGLSSGEVGESERARGLPCSATHSRTAAFSTPGRAGIHASERKGGVMNNISCARWNVDERL